MTFQLDLALQIEHSQKLTPYYLLQNDAVLYFESYWKQETVADINFLNHSFIIAQEEFPKLNVGIYSN